MGTEGGAKEEGFDSRLEEGGKDHSRAKEADQPEVVGLVGVFFRLRRHRRFNSWRYEKRHQPQTSQEVQDV